MTLVINISKAVFEFQCSLTFLVKPHFVLLFSQVPVKANTYLKENEKLFREQILWVSTETEKKNNNNNNQTKNNNEKPLKQNQKTILKFTRSHKNPQIINAVLSKKTNLGGITIPDLKIYYRTTVTKTNKQYGVAKKKKIKIFKTIGQS